MSSSNSTKNNFLVSALTKVDFYGDHVNLKFGKNNKYKSVVGGIITVILGVTLVLATVSFGADFIARDNSIVNKDEQNLKNTDIPYLDSGSLEGMYAVVSILSFNASQIKIALTEENSSSVKTCSEEQLAKFESSSIFIYYCIPLDNYAIGLKKEEKENEKGEIEQTSSLKTIKFNIDLCEKGSPGCMTSEHSSAMITLKMPIVSFLSSVRGSEAAQMTFKDLGLTIRGSSVSFLTVKFSTFVLLDDVGWIFSSTEEYRKISYESYTITERASGEAQMQVGMQLNPRIDTYSRRYEKLAELAATIGGFLKILSTFFSVYRFSFQKLFIEYDMAKKLIRSDVPPKENKFNNYTSKEKDRSDLQLSLKVNHKTAVQKHKTTVLDSSVKSNKGEFAVSRCEILKLNLSAMFCKKRISKRLEKLWLCLEIMNSNRDYLTIQKRLSEFEILKSLLLNDKQILMLSLQAKPLASPEIDDNSVIAKNFTLLNASKKDRIKEVKQYFIESVSAGCLTETDHKLFNGLPYSIQQAINDDLAIKQGVV